MKCNIRPKGYNVFQARIYTITDDINEKITFMSKSRAIRHIQDSFNQERNGQLIARGVIRTIDPILRVWTVPWSVDNPHASLMDVDNAVVDLWKTTFYNMGDAVILSKTYEEEISENQLEKQMIALNAFYVVVSCHEIGMPERFVIAQTYRNKHFSLKILNYNPDASKLKQGETLEQRYQQLLDEDNKETELIKAIRARQTQDKYD